MFPLIKTFLNQKYGYRPLPPKIPATDFQALRAAVEDGEDAALVDKWFLRDDNAVPPEYVLQQISAHFSTFDENSESDAHEQQHKEFWGVVSALRRAFRDAAKKALDKSLARKYFTSGA